MHHKSVQPPSRTPHLTASEYVACRCAALRGIRDDIEKEHAFLGLCALLRLNPQVRHCAPLAAAAACLGAFGLLAAPPPPPDPDQSPNPNPVQGAGNCFTALCEAIVSWHHVGCEGLHNELIQLMQASSQ